MSQSKGQNRKKDAVLSSSVNTDQSSLQNNEGTSLFFTSRGQSDEISISFRLFLKASIGSQNQVYQEMTITFDVRYEQF